MAEGRLEETAQWYGIEPMDLESAIRRWLLSRRAPYERGLAELYRMRYPSAVASLQQAMRPGKEHGRDFHISLAAQKFLDTRSWKVAGIVRRADSTRCYRRSCLKTQPLGLPTPKH